MPLSKGISWGFDSAGGPRTKTAILLMRINEIFNESDGQTAKEIEGPEREERMRGAGSEERI